MISGKNVYLPDFVVAFVESHICVVSAYIDGVRKVKR